MSNTHDDQYDNMLTNLSMLTVQEFLSHRNKFLFMALKNGSKRCADFLLSKEASANCNEIMRKCEYQRMVEVYTLLEELSNKYEEQIKDIVVNQKPHLINRLVDPSKLDVKNERVDFLFKLISDGFFTAEEVRQQIENNYRDKPEKKSKFISLYREITLKELGI